MRTDLPKKVLYLEDNFMDADLVRRSLARQAPEMVLDIAPTVAQAMELLARPGAGYEVILSDLSLPDGTGLELLAHVREQNLPIAVVILTGSGDQAAAVAALKSGADDYVVKRADYGTRLIHTLAAALARFHSELAGKARLLRVIYAEHNRFDVDLTRRHFTAHAPQIRLHIVDGGADVLNALPQELAANPPFDVVLLDFQLTGVNALEIAKILRDERGYDLPVVLVTGHGSEDVVAEALRLGVADYLMKHEGYLMELPAVLEHAHRRAQLMREQAKLRIVSERQRLQAAALNSSRDAVMITDLDARILSVNPAFTEITGYTEAEAAGAHASLLHSGRHDHAFFKEMWDSLLEHGQWQGEVWNRRKNAELYPQWLTVSAVRDTEGTPTHYVAVMTDLTLLRRSEAQREHLANYDPLTDLPNRVLLRSLLQHALEKAQRQKYQLAVLFLNLDKFKTINDSLGHAFGDSLLLAVTGRLNQCLGGRHILGRLSADEFVVVMEETRDPTDAESLAFELLVAMDSPFSVEGTSEIYAHTSIGISLFPQDGTTAHDLLHRADAAVHRAKERGGNQVAFYTSDLSRRALAQLEIDAGLRRALPQNELVLHYQPKAALASGCITGAEALLRWQRPGYGLVPPSEFISLAEKNGQIVPIGAWVIDEACRQVRAWNDDGLAGANIAVNVSLRQFHGEELEGVVADALARHGVPAGQLTLELTESTLIEKPDLTIDRLRRLKRIGLKLSLDDFGTGYSSLSYLSRFPLDQIKIDRSFVVDVVTNPTSATIANSVIDLAHRMQLNVIAEGVETEEQLAYLRGKCCDEMQGYYFCKPVCAEEFATLLRSGKALPH
ncbi:EAL domain-containing protein [Herbaspirillum sp. HC18]|nr:EAL domain-containing protein [Herbaspirillum sp. HC18]